MIFTTLIDVESLAALLRSTPERGGPVLLDCRFTLADPGAGRRAYLTAHIPGARFADLNQDLSAPVSAESGRHPLPDPAALTRFLAAAGIGADTQVIVYDAADGSMAARGWWLLRWLGHARVAVLDGGFQAWTSAGGALESGAPADAAGAGAPTTAAAAVHVRPEFLMTADDVRRALADPRRLVLDARAPERFAGTVEPLDAVAGHVPGAVNHPFSRNSAADGRFLPAAELRRRWQESLRGRDPADAILMCGSGVTACHNVLAMEAAGLPGAKLYAGSWSEWIRDPARPVALGAAPPP